MPAPKEQQSFEESGSPRTRRPSQTYYGSEKQVLRDGRKIKEIEVTGERPDESETDMKKQKKLQRRKSIDKEELNISCRALGKADHEGWLFKKAGGHGIVPVSWKKFWVVIKLGKLYCYKTSFNMQADYLFLVNDYSVDKATEKKKNFAFILKPNEEEKKVVTFACETEEECNNWIEIINKILSGVDFSNEEDHSKVRDYEDHKRLNAIKPTHKEEHQNNGVRKHRPISIAFHSQEDEETTGLPAGFGTRTSSTSQPRVRKMSAGTGAPSSVLSVGSMFHKLDEKPKEDQEGEEDDDVELKDLLYKEVEVEIEEKAPQPNGGKAPSPKPAPAPVVEPIAKQVIQTKEREDEKTASIDAETIIKEMEEKAKEDDQEQTPEPAPVEASVSVESVEEPKAPVAEPEASSDETEQPAEVAKQPEAPVVESPSEPQSPAEPEPAQPEELAVAASDPEPPKVEVETTVEQQSEEKSPEPQPPAVEEESKVPSEVESSVSEDEKPVVTDESNSEVPVVEPKAPEAPESQAVVVDEESKEVESQPEALESVEIATTEEVVTVESSKADESPENASSPQSEEENVESPVDSNNAPEESASVEVNVDNSGDNENEKVVENVVIETKTETNENGQVIITETTTTTTTVEVDELDIPSLDSGNSSLMDDITMELAAK